jgi:replication factor A1
VWGQKAQENADAYSANCVVALKGVKVGDYGGRTLGVQHSSTLTINPDLSEAHALRGWYDQGGAQQGITSLSSNGGGGGGDISGGIDTRKTFSSVKDEGLGFGAKPDYITVKGTITFIRGENMWYPACPNDVDGRTCNKKVIEVQAPYNISLVLFIL